MGTTKMSGHQNQLQDAFLSELTKEQIEATLYLINGVELVGFVTRHDKFSLVLQRNKQSQLVYKSAISTIMPMKSIDLETSDHA